MKHLLAFAAVVFLPLAMAAQTQHIKFKQDGAFANLQATVTDAVTGQPMSISLGVSRSSSTGSGSSASLTYTAFEQSADFNSFTITNIFGAIPASALTGENTQHLILDFDTSTLDPTTSSSDTCTIVFVPFSFTCVPGPVGLIHLEFSENDVQRTQILNLDEVVTSGPVTTHIHQRSDTSTANVQGSVFGIGISGPIANVGINNNSSIELMHN
ncbi:MAG TPA: hypothetical protein VKL40_00355 [Candidatus Angelobacter sp.]|nr:hypothetical protein [Candidatus Angelobacter sp.]